MRWRDKPKRIDPETFWHRRFAWRPVRFEYGVWPKNNAWLEWVIAKKGPGILFPEVSVWSYRPAEDAVRFPGQFGPGKKG